MPKLCLGVLESSAGHLKHGGVRPSERVPTEPRSPDVAARWLQMATEQIGVAESCSQVRAEHKCFFRTLRRIAQSNALLESLSLVDDLTGLYNRKGFFALAEHRVKLADRSGAHFSIAFVDFDGLKRINDTFGHQEGNRALVDTANVLRECFRESDILARIGGDEFAIFIADAEESQIDGIESRIQQGLATCNSAAGRRYRLSFSTGIVPSGGQKTSDLETLLAMADTLMYQQKSNRQCSRDEGAAPAQSG